MVPGPGSVQRNGWSIEVSFGCPGGQLFSKVSLSHHPLQMFLTSQARKPQTDRPAGRQTKRNGRIVSSPLCPMNLQHSVNPPAAA